MPEVRADAPSPFVIRETHPGRAFPLFYTGATLDPHSGRIVSEGWAGDPSAALGMTRDWADYTAGHFNRVARLDETRYTYDVLLRIDAVAGFNAAVGHATKSLDALANVVTRLVNLTA